MKKLLAAFVIAGVAAACGSSTPAAPSKTTPTPAPTPITAANLVSVSLGTDCESRRSLAATLGLPAIDNCHISGTISNTSSGCASNVHGSTQIQETGASAEWSVSFTVTAFETFAFSSASPMSIPTAGYHYHTAPSWTNVRC